MNPLEFLHREIWRVGGCTFAVRYVSGASLPEDTHGECDFAARIIAINDSMTPQMKLRTLFHELIHAACFLNESAAGVAEAMAVVLMENYEEGR